MTTEDVAQTYGKKGYQGIIETSDHVEGKVYGRKTDDPPGLMISSGVHTYYEAQAGRLPGREIANIPFEDIKFSLLTQDQVDAAVAAAIIMSHDHIDKAWLLGYHRPDHELAAMDVFDAYYTLRNHGFLRAYLIASERINKGKFDSQLDAVIEKRANEGPIQIPLVQQLTLALMERLDLQVFYANFTDNLQEPELRKLMAGYAIDQENLITFLLGRIEAELVADPTRLNELDAALLEFEPYGHDFDPDFEAHREVMLRVSLPGLVRADLIRRIVTDIAGEEHLSSLEQQRPFKEKLLAV